MIEASRIIIKERPERLYPAIDGSRCSVPQPNIRLSSGSPAEDAEEGLEEPEESQQTRTRTQPIQSANQDEQGLIELIRDRDQSVMAKQLGVHVGILTLGMGIFL